MYEHYYVNQAGGGLPSVYSGVGTQRGHGLGSIIGSLFRGAMPILKTVGKKVGQQILKKGLDVAGDVVSGSNVKESLKRRAKEGTLSLLQSGGVNKRRRTSRPSTTSRKTFGGGRRKTRVITRDIFT